MLSGCIDPVRPFTHRSILPLDNPKLQVDDYKHPAPVMPKGRLAPVAGRSFGSCTPAQVRAKVTPYRHPEMMALGGSVYNGISSFQINWWLADWSPPAQIARALHGVAQQERVPGLRVPSYPHYGEAPYAPTTFRLGLDLETVNVWGLAPFVRAQSRRMSKFKSYRTPNGPSFNDNLAFGGAAIEDILYGTAGDYRRRLDAVPRADRILGKNKPTYSDIIERAKAVEGPIEAGKAAGALTKVFFAENSSFVLNPAREEDGCVEEMTPLDQVLLRQPKRLLVGVGSNSGLFTFLVSGQPLESYCSDNNFTFGKDVYEWKRYVSISDTADRDFIAGMDELLNKLVNEGGEIEHVYVLGQLRPSAIANLKPAKGLIFPPGAGKYYDRYELDFAPEGAREISGALVKEADQLNKKINDEIKTRVEARNGKTKTRFVFVSLDPMADSTDFKHSGQDSDRITITSEHLPGLIKPVKLDNRVLTFSRREEHLADGSSAGQRILQGGIFSIDNLHPTVIGYSLLANTVLDAIVAEEKIQLAPGAKESISPQAMYARYHPLDGNVLRRTDGFLASRADWFQVMSNLTATILGSRDLDCLPARPGEKK